MSRLTILSAVLGFACAAAPASLIDYSDRPGLQSASWPAGSTIMIFMDGITGQDRACFEMGVKSWDDAITNLTVQFKDGNRPEGMTGIQMMVVPAESLGAEFVQTLAAPLFTPPDANTGTLDTATINIDTR